MRLWSIHPRYLDAKGLVALWREALLAKKVLQGRTVGYTNHPQLIRFQRHQTARRAINLYLAHVYDEAVDRGYSFEGSKFRRYQTVDQIDVSTGQMAYEWKHLLGKLKIRDSTWYRALVQKKRIEPHPLFRKQAGSVESWERKQQRSPPQNS